MQNVRNKTRQDMAMAIIVLYGVFVFIIILLICFPVGSKSKHSTSTSTSRNACPSERANFLSKLFLSWFSSYVWENYKKPVKDNLWDVSEEDSATYISAKFEKYLTRASRKRQNDAESINVSTICSDRPKSRNEQISILKLLFKVYKFQLITSSLWRMLDALLPINYPIIFSILTSYMNEAETTWELYACTLAFAVNAILNAFISARYFQDLGKLQQHFSSILASMIYKKILRTSDGTRRAYTIGEMVNIMTVDVKRITDGLTSIQYLCTVPFQFILAFYFLWKVVLGSCVVSNILMLIVILPINKYMNDAMMKQAKIETLHRNKRGKFVQDLLAGIKILKMYAWEANFEKKASSLREEESKHLKKSGHIYDCLSFLYKCITPMMSFVSFETYFYFTHQIVNVVQAFLSISFFNTFKSTLNMASIQQFGIIQAQISIKRINDFLNLPELRENAISHDRVTNVALTMKNTTFSWTNDKESVVLRDLNLEIKKGALVTIVGPVGSGKSSLLSAFLGELQKISGYINIDGEIAYVPQQAWILNTTFKENVTLGAPVDESLYKNTLEACSLDIDLQTFPANDFTEIGEKGINLSGGQKQRINIARALCRNADIYLFDDSMSAVDVHVSKHIFQHVIGPNGILNQKTRVLVTHNTTFLAQSDFIAALSDGRIVESGTFQELMEKKGYFSTLLAKYSNKVKAEDSNHITEQCVDNVDLGIRKLCQEKVVSLPSNDAVKLIDKEHIETVTVNKEIFKYLLSTIGIWIVILVLILDITALVFSLSSRIWLAIWLSKDNDNDNSYSVQFYLLIYLALGLGEALFLMISGEVLLSATIRSSSLIYKKLLSSVLNWPLWLLDCTPVGRIINRATSDVNTLDTILCKRLKLYMELCEKFLIILLVTCYVEPISIAIFVVVLIITYILQHQYQSLAYQLMRINSNNSSFLSSHVVETINGLASIRANKFQEKLISLLHEKIDLCSPTPIAITINYKWCGIRLEIMLGLAISMIIFLVLRQRNTLEIETVCFVISYIIQLTKEFQFFLIYVMDLESSIISVERMKQYIDMPQEKNAERTCQVIQEWPTKGVIQFHKYKLRYRQHDDLVLKGLTFRVESGEKIGIIGRTGAGKSSLILALMRLVEPADGTIFIDDVDIREVELRILRSRLTIIPQDSVSFLGTLRFNLDPTETCDDEALWNALEKSNLKNFVQQLPDRLETVIEESGGNLSGGQKQLLCLARALIRKSQILILDEATASVDVETDELIQKTIRREFSQCTVLTVAHRLNTIQDYDRILVMDNGKVMEYDTPDNLLQLKSSMFYTIMLKAGLIRK